MESKEKMEIEKLYLGIELGSTRIKALLIDEVYRTVASGSYEWENKLENGYWTYSLEEIHKGVQGCFAGLAAEVRHRYGTCLTTVCAMGISGMMHGYLAFDRNNRLLVPFKTWRNTTTEKAAAELTELFGFNIPQRWSVAHLYQAILNREPHVPQIAYITTLAGYIHFLLTERHEAGVGEASGMFPVNGAAYRADMLEKFDHLARENGYEICLNRILPEVRMAGQKGAYLTEAGARFLDPTGMLRSGIPLCPPEGDAGTGMIATNAVVPKTGNISAGTSVFSMLVLEKPLKGVYPEIDLVATPNGLPVAMVHCNNGCSELDGWVKIFGEFADAAGMALDKTKLYQLLYHSAMKGNADCGGMTAYNCLSGEPVTGVVHGRPMYFRLPQGKMSLANFMRAQLYASMAALRLGMDILFEKEGVASTQIQAHGGLFKVQGAAQQMLADAMNTPVAVMETAGEGGAWGMALLAAYMLRGNGSALEEWLDSQVFAQRRVYLTAPDQEGVSGFARYMERYKGGLAAERRLGEVQ